MWHNVVNDNTFTHVLFNLFMLIWTPLNLSEFINLIWIIRPFVRTLNLFYLFLLNWTYFQRKKKITYTSHHQFEYGWHFVVVTVGFGGSNSFMVQLVVCHIDISANYTIIVLQYIWYIISRGQNRGAYYYLRRFILIVTLTLFTHADALLWAFISLTLYL